MKRILFILTLAVMVGGCWNRGDVTSEGSLLAQRFTYEGHQYILFTEGLWDQTHGGVVHDPDCPCHHQVAQTLSEWDKMILAISYTESRWNRCNGRWTYLLRHPFRGSHVAFRLHKRRGR